MKSIRNIFILLLASLSIGQGCNTKVSSTPPSEAVMWKYLLGPTGRTYWDLVYSTDAEGRYQRTDVKGRYPAAGLRFTAPNKLFHYSNLDSLRVRDAGCHLDIVFNPSKFTLTDDTITWFTDNKYIVKYLSDDIMVLKHIDWANPRAFDVYQKSAIQEKIIVKCEP